MSVATSVAGTRGGRKRLAFMALALVLGAGSLLLLLQPAGAQINIPSFSSIVCPILLAVRNSFADSPFFSFIGPILNTFLSFFGCGISG